MGQGDHDILTRAAQIALRLSDGNVTRALSCFKARLRQIATKSQPKVSARRLRQLFSYDPETGNFTWRVGRKAGRAAGWKSNIGYHVIHIDYVTYYAHRLAWLYVTGAMPEMEIDHINGNGFDNRWRNLRHVTHANNVVNRAVSDKKKSKLPLGVCIKNDGRSKKYIAKIKTNGREYVLGAFYTAEEASAAYQQKARELWGRFVRS